MKEQKTHLTEHQALLFEMLRDFDGVCRRHNIHYQLFAGTALGAVRHSGFIPWDDDVDVILMRDEYERFFREAAPDFDPVVYYVQKDNSPHWPMQFSKLIHTLFYPETYVLSNTFPKMTINETDRFDQTIYSPRSPVYFHCIA